MDETYKSNIMSVLFNQIECLEDTIKNFEKITGVVTCKIGSIYGKSFQIFSGIDKLSDFLNVETSIRKIGCYENPLEKSLKFEDYEFFQLSETDGTFR